MKSIPITGIVTVINIVHKVHYENLPMQYTDFSDQYKLKIFIKFFLIFFLFLLKTECGYMSVRTASPRRFSNEYPHSLFWIKNKKNRYTSANSIFFCIHTYNVIVYIIRNTSPNKTQ